MENLIGKTFNYWTVLEDTYTSNSDGHLWKCQCKCGIIKNVSGKSLKNGRSKSCGCWRKTNNMPRVNLIGQNFDDLTVTNITEDRDSTGSIIWECQCKCGNKCYKSTSYLHRNIYHSCGCYGKNQITNLNKKNLIGQRFGKLVVLEETSERKWETIVWKCKCDCGNIINVPTNSLKTGNTSSCGCINYSIGEKNIEKILKENNIDFKSQYSCKELQLKRFDFAILNEDNQIIRLIEFDGSQHYNDISGIWNSAETLEDIQKRDNEKNIWAKEHNIPLVRIPYWERDNITLEMIMEDQYLV